MCQFLDTNRDIFASLYQTNYQIWVITRRNQKMTRVTNCNPRVTAATSYNPLGYGSIAGYNPPGYGGQPVTKISDDPVSIAEVLRDLRRPKDDTEQSYSERQIYQSALERLAREVAAIEKTSEDDAATKLEAVLSKAA